MPWVKLRERDVMLALVCVLVTIATAMSNHCTSYTGRDPCYPPLPCDQKARMSFPPVCFRYQICIAPYEWLVTDSECGGTKGSYSNLTCQCSRDYTCDLWECPDTPVNVTEPPIMMSEPCFVQPSDVICVEGSSVPDRYYCTSYFKCIEGAWIRQSCLQERPYYDVSIPNALNPCSNNPSRCNSIPFSECQTYTTEAPVTTASTVCVTVQTTATTVSTTTTEADAPTTAAAPTTTITTGVVTTLLPTTETTTTSTSTTAETSTTADQTSTIPVLTTTIYATTSKPVEPTTTPRTTASTLSTASTTTTLPDSPCLTYDPCSRPYPCTMGQQLAVPTDCDAYQLCVAPYEWVILEECGGGLGPFSNRSCACDPTSGCSTWTCPSNITYPNPPALGPCFTSPRSCQTAYQTVPDIGSCTNYWECVSGSWVNRTCPDDLPFYDTAISFRPPPCRDEPYVCDQIPFDECLPYSTPSSN